MPRKGGTPANLKPFKPGKDKRRNMNGAPKGTTISSYLKKLLEGTINLLDEKGNKIQLTRAEAIALKLLSKALSKSATDQAQLKAIEQILDRTEGKSKQNFGFTNEDGEDVPLTQIVVKDSETKKALENLKR